MWRLATRSLLADRRKLLAALAGVAFSVVLINLQGGLYLGLIQKASLLVDYGQADIWVGHRHINNVDVGTFIPERWLQRIRSVAGVERADAYIVGYSRIVMPDGRFENVIIVGSDPASLLGNAWVMAQGDPSGIRRPDAVLVDAFDTTRLGGCDLGDIREINGRRARVVGMTRGIVGFTTDPYIFTTLEARRRDYVPGIPAESCSYFLIKAEAGADVGELAQRIRQRVPELDVYDRESYSQTCMEYWLLRTGIGISFGLAALLGLLVGLAVVAQTLYTSANDQLRQFATLKALGASENAVAGFLMAQALAIALLGSTLGLLLAFLVGNLIDSPRAPVVFDGRIMISSSLLILAVCLLAAWLPYRRLRAIDPASVLRG